MSFTQRRFLHSSARKSARAAVLFIAIVAVCSVAVAQPGSLTGPSNVYFDPHYSPPAHGSDLQVVPSTPLNVISPLNFNFTPVGNLLAMQSGTPAQQALAAQVVGGFVAAADR